MIIFLLFLNLLKTVKKLVGIFFINKLVIVSIKLILLDIVNFFNAVLQIGHLVFLFLFIKFIVINLTILIIWFHLLLVLKIRIFTISFKIHYWLNFIIFINELKIRLNFFLNIIFVHKLIWIIFIFRLIRLTFLILFTN